MNYWCLPPAGKARLFCWITVGVSKGAVSQWLTRAGAGGPVLHGTGVVIYPLEPFESAMVYFRANYVDRSNICDWSP